MRHLPRDFIYISICNYRIQPTRSSPMAMPGGRRVQRHSSGSSDVTPSPLLIEAGKSCVLEYYTFHKRPTNAFFKDE